MEPEYGNQKTTGRWAGHMLANTRILAWFVQHMKFSTLKRRVVFSLAAIVLLCVILITSVSYHAIRKIQENNMKTTLLFDLDQQSNKPVSYTHLTLPTIYSV